MKVFFGYKVMMVEFVDDFKCLVMIILWGDVFMVYYFFGILNIEIYIVVYFKMYCYVKLQKYFGWFLCLLFVKVCVCKWVLSGFVGLFVEQCKNGCSFVWGWVMNVKGEIWIVCFVMLEGYIFIVLISVMIVEWIFKGQAKFGF